MALFVSSIEYLSKKMPDFLKPGKPLFSAVLIIIIGTAIYSNTFNVPFYFDDIGCISSNSVIHNYFGSWSGPVPPGSLFDADIVNSMQLRPVGYFTFAVNYWLHGLNVTGYHVVNLIIHLGTGLAIYAFVHALIRTPLFIKHERHANSMKYLPLVIALLFVCHPVQTSAVTYTVQRFTSLAALFYMASITLYVRGRIAMKKKGACLIAVSAIAALVAMFCKENAFTLPFMTLLCEIFFFEGTLRQRITYLLPISLTLPVIPLNTMRLTGYDCWEKGMLHDATNLVNLTGVDRWEYLFTQFRVLFTYFRLMVFPVNQHLDYDYPLYTTLGDPAIVFSIIVHLMILTAAVVAWRISQQRSSYSLPLRIASFGVFWFYLAISVSSSLIPLDDLIFEYRLYLPSFGFILTVSMLYYAAWSFFAVYLPVNVFHASVPVLLVILTLSLTTYQRNHVWRDSERFWEDNVEKAPDKARPHLNLGVKYLSSGKLSKAVVELEKVVEISRRTNKTTVSVMINLGLAYARLFLYDDAQRAFKSAVDFDPENADARRYYAEMLGLVGRHEEAMEQAAIAERLSKI